MCVYCYPAPQTLNCTCWNWNLAARAIVSLVNPLWIAPVGIETRSSVAAFSYSSVSELHLLELKLVPIKLILKHWPSLNCTCWNWNGEASIVANSSDVLWIAPVGIETLGPDAGKLRAIRSELHLLELKLCDILTNRKPLSSLNCTCWNWNCM